MVRHQIKVLSILKVKQSNDKKSIKKLRGMFGFLFFDNNIHTSLLFDSHFRARVFCVIISIKEFLKKTSRLVDRQDVSLMTA